MTRPLTHAACPACPPSTSPSSSLPSMFIHETDGLVIDGAMVADNAAVGIELNKDENIIVREGGRDAGRERGREEGGRVVEMVWDKAWDAIEEESSEGWIGALAACALL